jgi:hypothetical protein
VRSRGRTRRVQQGFLPAGAGGRRGGDRRRPRQCCGGRTCPQIGQRREGDPWGETPPRWWRRPAEPRRRGAGEGAVLAGGEGRNAGEPTDSPRAVEEGLLVDGEGRNREGAGGGARAHALVCLRDDRGAGGRLSSSMEATLPWGERVLAPVLAGVGEEGEQLRGRKGRAAGWDGGHPPGGNSWGGKCAVRETKPS